MRNLKKTKNAQVQCALPVPAGRVAGQTVKLGNAGLRGLMHTERTVADTEFQVGGAVGVPLGYATCELIGVHTTVKVPFAAAIALFAPVYIDANDNYTADSASGANTKVGCTLEALTGQGQAEVALF